MPGFWYAGTATVALALAAPLVAGRRFATPYAAALAVGALVLSGHGPTPLHWMVYLLPGFAELHPHLPERIVAILFLGTALLAGATLTCLAREKQGARIAALLLVVAFADVLTAANVTLAEYAGADGVHTLPRVDLNTAYEPSGVERFLGSRPGPFGYFGYAPEVGGLAYTQRFVEPETAALVVNNRSMSLGLHDVQGYNAIHVGRYDEYLAAMNGRPQNYHNAEVFRSGLASPLLDLLNARYIVVPARDEAIPRHAALPELERTYPIVYHDDRVKVLENPEALPRAWIVHAARQVGPGQALELLASGAVDPRRTAVLEEPPPDLGDADDVSVEHASIIGYDPDRIRLTTSTTAPSLLMLSEIYYPSWRAYVDDRPAALHVADHALRAVPVPPGEHLVELRYESSALRVGMAISLSAYAALGALAVAAGVPWQLDRRSAQTAR